MAKLTHATIKLYGTIADGILWVILVAVFFCLSVAPMLLGFGLRGGRR